VTKAFPGDFSVDLFAGLPVRNLAKAQEWYERLLGPAAFLPDETEAVWQIGEHRYLYIDVRPEDAGHGMVTLFLDDLAAFLAIAAGSGITPDSEETYENGVRKVTFRDPDGNEIGFGGGPG
jgi:catechol 2,3-dioxygenase-like lactoylglutathione lyase family enzyme